MLVQIYDDKKKRIGTLSGYRNLAITKTLHSGDKELSFEYPINGNMERQLKEEYYIRTKEDEFILKAVETGKQYNKYTAVINVEELEGKAFPLGFASREQTVRACLEFAFEGTGWSIGICTVTKKRTIDIEEPATAWKVMQSCLSTYRCECEIDTLQKRIDIYAQIGQDKGCYFMEGLNLRKLAATSDTYEFYTRIIPIGKDGITIEWLHGKEYLENYQYSSKIKTYIWKDERYTNTTSLMEDAEEKLEELSKPYKVYAADVADLAKANPEYKDILDYGIGDTVMMVSKHPRMREKQRIVKIVEYPEAPEKNTVELSNTAKTFAEVQKTETELAKTEAISIANRTTKKVLQDYSTIEEVETKIVASKESIELGVMHTLESYYDKSETDALIEVTKGEIKLEASGKYQTKEAMNGYYTAKETKSLIDLATDEIEISVSETLESYATTGEMEKEISKAEAKIGVVADKIDMKVSKGDVASQISLETGKVELKGNRVSIQSNNFKLSEMGETEATGKFTSTTADGSGNTYESVLGDAGLRIKRNGSETGRVTSGNAGSERGIALQTTGVAVITNGTAIGYIFNPNGTIISGQRNILQGGARVTGDLEVADLLFSGKAASLYGATYDGADSVASNGGFYAYGSIGCSGTKYRVVDTDNFGTVGMNALETPSAFFADIGSGLIGEDGKCYVFIEDIFSETIDRNHDTYIQVTATDGNEVRVIEKNPMGHFVVSGNVGATFDWIMFAKQKHYAVDRAEGVDVPKQEIPYNDAVFANDDTPAYLSETYMSELNTDYDELANGYLTNYYEEVLSL